MYHRTQYPSYPYPPPSARPPPPAAHHPPPPRPPLSVPSPIQPQHPYYNMSAVTPSSAVPPPSPSAQSEDDRKDEEMRTKLGPAPFTTLHDDKIWALEVRQQPEKARMCGFGDKDRRPINPPPCIRLLILDAETHEEIDYKTVETGRYIMTVDLWNAEGNQQHNIVNGNSNQPSISSVHTSAYPQTVTTHSPQTPPQYDSSRIPAYSGQQFASPISAGPRPPPQAPLPDPYYGHRSDPALYAGSAPPYGRHPSIGYAPYQMPPVHANGYHSMPQQPLPPPPPNTMVTQVENIPPEALSRRNQYSRNLIGSLCASANKLNDDNEVAGIWFILHDLSIRTEGWFRLKMNFIDIGAPHEDAGPNSNLPELANHAPVLASIYSAPFKVWTAKKFPGVGNATALSKAFATQGIKIPIRKESQLGTKRKANSDDPDEDGSGDEYDD